jgi:hypothetical protein
MSIVERPPMDPMVGDRIPCTEGDAPRRSRYDLRTGVFEPIE